MNVWSASGVGFNTVIPMLRNMGKEERFLHRGNNDDPSLYFCGKEIPHNSKMLTDAQALALRTCPNCFPNGRPSFLVSKKRTLKVTDVGGEWI